MSVRYIAVMALLGLISSTLSAESFDDISVHSLAEAPRAHQPAGFAERSESDLGTRVLQALEAVKSGEVSVQPKAALAARVGRDVAIAWRPGVGTPMQIKGPALHEKIAGVDPKSDSNVLTARSFLRANRQLLRLQDPDRELKMRSKETDELGLTHVRFDQRYRGLEVWPADLTVHLGEAGEVYLLNGAFVPTPRLPTIEPIVPRDQAENVARDRIAQVGVSYRVVATELLISVLDPHRPRLAWMTKLAADEPKGWQVLTDAISGAHLATLPTHLPAAGSGVDVHGIRRPLDVLLGPDGLYWLVDTSKPMFNPQAATGLIATYDAVGLPYPQVPAIIVRSVSPGAWQPDQAVSAQFYLAEAYEYYRAVHGRDSINGQGSSIEAIVRNGACSDNASWPMGSGGNGPINFCLGTPWAGSPDVVGHELTHGVIEFSANLVYRHQSGAMNEAWADILGTMVERRIQGTLDWVVGDDIRPMRSFSRPEDHEQPRKMSQYQHVSHDHGGVHINSGIINHAFYQLVEGLPGAIGPNKAEKIFYRALVRHLNRHSQFIDARFACIQAAEELYGSGSVEAQKVAQAFNVVEIYGAGPTPPPPPNPTVDASDATSFLFWDGDEGAWLLGRREAALDDPAAGVPLIVNLAPSRPSVSGDGEIVAFVASDWDACFAATDGSGFDCAGIPGQVFSLALAPGGERMAFVLRDQQGNAEEVIRVVELPSGRTETIPLLSPGIDGPDLNTVVAADAMDFTADGKAIYYDALNVLQFEDGSQVGAWSIFVRDLSTDLTFNLVPPLPGYQIGFPAVANTSDYLVAFEAYEEATGLTGVFSSSVVSGEFGLVDVVEISSSRATPSYLGDDSGLVYSALNDQVPTFSSLMTTDLKKDKITPTGNPKVWLHDAAFGVIYRRGEFQGPPDAITSTAYPDFRFWVWILPSEDQVILGKQEPECIAETVCVSGALAGRSEVFLRIVGPKPNGLLWPTVVKFSTSRVEVRVEQISTGQTRHYILPGAGPGSSSLSGGFDRFGFFPTKSGTAVTNTSASQEGPVTFAPADAVAPRIGPPPPPGPWLSASALGGGNYRAKVRLNTGAGSILGSKEPDCIPETLCVSGAIPGRSEVFVRVVGPKPNGFMWPTLVKFSTSELEIWVEQVDTGKINYYLLPGASPGSSDLPGLFDREGFLP